MKKLLLIMLAMLASRVCTFAFSLESTKFHCEKDTTEINALLHDAAATGTTDPNKLISLFADKLLGTPYVAHTLEGDKEMLYIDIDELDCTTFIENLVALTLSTMEKQPSWYSFAADLERIRYHDGTLDGYASRLHYISAWIVENTARGFIYEVTGSLPHSENIIKTLNYMSVNRDKYPQLANDETFAAIKNLESGYNMHMFPYIHKNNLGKKDLIAELRDGDIIAITTKTDGLDVSHMGIIRFVKGKPHLLHASSIAKKVIIEKYPLFEMLRSNRNATGIRVLRMKAAY